MNVCFVLFVHYLSKIHTYQQTDQLCTSVMIVTIGLFETPSNLYKEYLFYFICAALVSRWKCQLLNKAQRPCVHLLYHSSSCFFSDGPLRHLLLIKDLFSLHTTLSSFACQQCFIRAVFFCCFFVRLYAGYSICFPFTLDSQQQQGEVLEVLFKKIGLDSNSG